MLYPDVVHRLLVLKELCTVPDGISLVVKSGMSWQDTQVLI